MNEYLRDRILRKLDTLSDERLYQVLDFVEFLETKYAERPEAAPGIFTRFAEAVEDRLRAGQVSASTIAETMGLMGKAMGILEGVAAAGKSVANDVAAAGKSVASDLVGTARQAGRPGGQGATAGATAGHGAQGTAGGATMGQGVQGTPPGQTAEPGSAGAPAAPASPDGSSDSQTGATGATTQPPGERRA